MTTLRLATLALVIAIASPIRADELKTCVTPHVKDEIREASGSSIDALMNAVAFIERRYGAPHSRKRVSNDEVRMIYRNGKGAVSVSLARDETGRITTDCIAY